MRLLFLHGMPASGKLTVAKALLHAIPGRLLDNHASIDLAGTVFDFDAPGFWELVHSVRLSALRAAVEHDVPLLVTTFCYSEPEDRDLFEQFEEIVLGGGGALLPVFLRCSEQEAIRRVGAADRKQRRKISSAEGLRAFNVRWNIAPVRRDSCLVVDTEQQNPDATAQQIIRHFDL